MGNKPGVIEESEGASSLVHFDHTFKAVLEYSSAGLVNPELETVENADVMLTFKQDVFEISHTDPKSFQNVCILNLGYHDISELCWDHATSSFKIVTKCEVPADEINAPDRCVVLKVENSLELEHELRLRLRATSRGARAKMPPFAYVGMFAGSTKPKPFQRKRPNLTKLAVGKLPPLPEMRACAIQRHRGMYKPTPAGRSRRMQKAIEHIETGCNTFEVLDARPFKANAKLTITDGLLEYGQGMDSLQVPFQQIGDWNVFGQDGTRKERIEIGLIIEMKDGGSLYFNARHTRDLRHTLEFFWNRYQHTHGGHVKPMSTHGRPLEIVYTLQGEVVAPPAPQGTLDVTDIDGQILRPGARRRSNSGRMLLRASTVAENLQVKKHWSKVVIHQGWLLKKGGAAKHWLKRYFVLYSTSQGHFLAYYADVADAPLFGGTDRHRNMIDLAKVTFIRPVSNNSEAPDHSFDIVTIEREWTLCAENRMNMQKWLRLITRAVDEDVAILPDDVLQFEVKARADPTGVLSRMDYSTAIEVSACGVTVKSPMEPGSDVSALAERFFWVFTDFYKWSTLSQRGKVALLLNVFADEGFNRRQEFIFRTKEAVRMATAIEFYIEKFMSVMHLMVEGDPQAYDNDSNGYQSNPQSPMSLHTADDHHGWDDHDDTRVWASDDDEPNDKHADLLGFDDTPPIESDTSNENVAASRQPSLDFVGQRTSVSSDPPPSNDPWSHTTFDDPFGANSPVAKELSADHQARNTSWYRALVLTANPAVALPLFDDGVVYITYQAEFRGSQARLQLVVRNNSDHPVANLNFAFVDPECMLRHQISSYPEHLDAHAELPLQIMVECMRPANNSPQLQFVYAQGRVHASHLIQVPLLMCSFNEPIIMTTQEFVGRWQSLSEQNQEAQAIVQAPLSISTAMEVLSALKFAPTTDGTSQCIAAAGTLKTGATVSSGEKINVGCLIQLELHPQGQNFRLHVRTVHLAATAALLEIMKKCLSYRG